MKRIDDCFAFKNKTALITGATSGLGLALALELARLGANVIAFGRNFFSNGINVFLAGGYLEHEHGHIKQVECDIGDHDSLVNALSNTISDNQTINILVNCAGIFNVESLEQTSIESWNRTINVNLRAPFITTKFISTHMKRNGGGRILNVGSISGISGIPGETSYASSKAGLIGMTKVHAVELIRYGIYVNCISPSDFDTPILNNVKGSPEHAEFINTRIPIGRMGTPDEFVYSALFLVSDCNTMIIGQNIMIDGGYSIS